MTRANPEHFWIYPERDELLREYFEAGYSDAEIAEFLDAPSAGSVRSRRAQLGLTHIERLERVERWVSLTPDELALVHRAAAVSRAPSPTAWASAVVANRVDEVLERRKRPTERRARLPRFKRAKKLDLRFTPDELARLKDVADGAGMGVSDWARVEILREAHEVLGRFPAPGDLPRPEGRSKTICFVMSVSEDDLVYRAAELAGLKPSTWGYDVIAREMELSGVRVANIEWTPEAERTIRAMFEAGATDRAIAEHLGVKTSAIIGFRRRRGLEKKRWTPEREAVVREMVEAGASDAEIGEALGVTAKAITGFRQKRRILRQWTWTPEREEIVRRMFAAGASDAKIARRVGSTRRGVQVFRSRAGIVRDVFWTRERDLQLKDMFERGLSDAEIADALGVSLTAAKSRRQLLRLSRAERTGPRLAEEPKREEMCLHFTPRQSVVVKGLAQRVAKPPGTWIRETLLEAASRAVEADERRVANTRVLKRRLMA